MFPSLPFRGPTLALLFGIAPFLAACGGGGGGGDGQVGGARLEAPTRLEQAAYRPGTSEYEYGYRSVPTVGIEGAPTDADFSRWAMLHDGSRYHLYVMAFGTNARIYDFAYDAGSNQYRFGLVGRGAYGISQIPADADTSRIAMLHDGSDYRLYMRGKSDPTQLYQFALDMNQGSFVYGYRSIARVAITGAPADADLSRWGMLHDGDAYRLYVGRRNSPDTLYQFGFDGARYAFGYDAIPSMRIVGMPGGGAAYDFAMLHDGSDYRLYRLGW